MLGAGVAAGLDDIWLGWGLEAGFVMGLDTDFDIGPVWRGLTGSRLDGLRNEYGGAAHHPADRKHRVGDPP
jgi:hypothetical protein